MYIINIYLYFSAPYTPNSDSSNLFPGTWYNTHIDEMHRRKYERKPLNELPGNDCPVKNVQQVIYVL